MQHKYLMAMLAGLDRHTWWLSAGINNGHSKYKPHQGAAECKRRRNRMGTVMAMEEEFNAEIPDDVADGFETVGDVVGYFEGLK